MPAPALNGYALTNYFRRLRAKWDFTHLEAHLFLELMALCTAEKWPTEFSAKNNTLTAAVGCSEPGLIKARKRLAEAGLLTYTEGQNRRPTAYRFCTPKDLTEFSDSAGEHLTEGLTEFSDSATNEGKHLTEHLTEGLTEFSPLYKRKGKEKKVDAADAATSPSSSVFEKQESQPPAHPKKNKGQKQEATAEEIAALPLPFDGAEFAELWANFLKGSKQSGKTLFAYQLMLKHLRKKPEAFACLMLERATVGNWQGVENPGTARDFGDWQVEQARCPAPPSSTGPVLEVTSPVRPEAIAENTAKAGAALAQRQADFHARQAANGDPTALPMPHPGAEFAGLWAGFLSGTKQQGKSMEAYHLMLKQLGNRPEAFACLMLERATAGDWSRVENDGTPAALTKWQANQAAQPSADTYEPEAPLMNPEFLAQQEGKKAAARAARLAELSPTPANNAASEQATGAQPTTLPDSPFAAEPHHPAKSA